MLMLMLMLMLVLGDSLAPSLPSFVRCHGCHLQSLTIFGSALRRAQSRGRLSVVLLGYMAMSTKQMMFADSPSMFGAQIFISCRTR
jgi:hypothetical protein